jgi:6-phosphogluconolactonase
MRQAVAVTYKVFPTPAAVAAAAAELFTSVAEEAAASTDGMARIAISGGGTPKAMFVLLADRSQAYFARVPWNKLQLFWVDERCVPPTDPESNYGVANQLLLSKVPLPAAQVYRMEGEIDPSTAAKDYAATIRAAFRLNPPLSPIFDLVLLGMGDDGHTASLFPHTEALNDMINIVTSNHVPQKDTWRITLTWPVINQARRVAFLIEGASKAEVLSDVFQGPYDPESKPSQLIRPASGELTLLLDQAAAAKLPAPDVGGSGTIAVE